MSQITKLECTICNPDARDGVIRRTVQGVTSQEFVQLVQHVVLEHGQNLLERVSQLELAAEANQSMVPVDTANVVEDQSVDKD